MYPYVLFISHCCAGNKLFQSRFITLLVPEATVFEAMQWTLLNSAIALVGYYVAAFTIDKPWMGRWRMQCTRRFRVDCMIQSPAMERIVLWLCVQ